VCVLAALLVTGCRSDSATAPELTPNVALVFEGTLTEFCNVISFQSCVDAPFGSGIQSGTSVRADVSFDSTTPAITAVNQPDFVSKRYYGADVNVRLGNTILSGADPAWTYIDVTTYPTLHFVSIVAMRGFPSAMVGGLSIDFFQLSLRISPTRHPDASLPTSAAAFTAALATEPFGVVLKHHDNPNFWQFGATAPGPMAGGNITSVR